MFRDFSLKKKGREAVLNDSWKKPNLESWTGRLLDRLYIILLWYKRGKIREPVFSGRETEHSSNNNIYICNIIWPKQQKLWRVSPWKSNLDSKLVIRTLWLSERAVASSERVSESHHFNSIFWHSLWLALKGTFSTYILIFILKIIVKIVATLHYSI